MILSIDISITDPQWETACPECEALTEKAIYSVFSGSPIARQLILNGVEPEISVVLANDDLVQTLNREYRNKDKPTNVLSFAQLDTPDGWQAPAAPGPCTLGDLILGFETVRTEAEQEKKSLSAHLTHLIIHGMLHLLGYDHMEEGPADAMESLEIQLLKGLGYQNPYSNA